MSGKHRLPMLVDGNALFGLVRALSGPEHMIRELQFTRSVSTGDDNCVVRLIEDFNAQARAHDLTISALEPQYYWCIVGLENLHHVLADGLPITFRPDAASNHRAYRPFYTSHHDAFTAAQHAQLATNRWEDKNVVLLAVSDRVFRFGHDNDAPVVTPRAGAVDNVTHVVPFLLFELDNDFKISPKHISTVFEVVYCQPGRSLNGATQP